MIKLKWYDKIAIWIKVIWLISVYGLEGAANQADKELRELERQLTNKRRKVF